MLAPTVRRTYAPRGETPIYRCCFPRGKISAISAITVSPKRKRIGLYFSLLPDDDNVHAKDTIAFLRLLHRHIPRPLTVVWDRSNTHDRAREVQKYLEKHPEIVTERFPGYAPDLNPDEGVWTYTKFGRLANFAPRGTTELRGRVGSELRRLRKRPDLLLSFIRHTGLDVGVEADAAH